MLPRRMHVRIQHPTEGGQSCTGAHSIEELYVRSVSASIQEFAIIEITSTHSFALNVRPIVPIVHSYLFILFIYQFVLFRNLLRIIYLLVREVYLSIYNSFYYWFMVETLGPEKL